MADQNPHYNFTVDYQYSNKHSIDESIGSLEIRPTRTNGEATGILIRITDKLSGASVEASVDAATFLDAIRGLYVSSSIEVEASYDISQWGKWQQKHFGPSCVAGYISDEREAARVKLSNYCDSIKDQAASEGWRLLGIVDSDYGTRWNAHWVRYVDAETKKDVA